MDNPITPRLDYGEHVRRIAVQNTRIAEYAQRVSTASEVERGELALEFERSVASSVHLHVEGRNFYPPLLADIASASSSVHINQFGFRPGLVGDRFADALISKAQDGVPVRLIVDRQGSDPERGSREFYERLTRAGIQVCVTRATQPRVPRGPLGAGGAVGWNLSGLGHIDHRKVVVVDGRIGWVGGAGIEDHFENGEFHDLFVRVEGPVVSQLQLVFVASLRWLGGEFPTNSVRGLFPSLDEGFSPVPAVVLHNAPGRFRPITTAIAALIDQARDTLDVVNPYVTDRRMIGRIVAASRRGARVRLFVPANPNNWACGAAEQFHHGRLIEAGVQILGYPKMLHAKAFVADGEHVLVGTCNLEAWSLRRFFEIDIGFESRDLVTQFEEQFFAPAEEVSSDLQPPSTLKKRVRAAAFAAISPLL
jgi:cardiolipin synthase